MVRKLLIALGTIVVMVGLYLAWFLYQVLKTANDRVETRVLLREQPLGIELSATLREAERSYRVTQIGFPRALAERLGVRPPSGFSEAAATAPGAEKRAPARAEGDRQTIWWEGERGLAPDSPVSIHNPVDKILAGRGPIIFVYEGKIGISGSIGSFYADVEIDAR